MATAELAIALPAVVLVLALCLTAMAYGIDQVRCVDAARVAARAASRGEPPALVRELAEQRAPANSTVTVSDVAGGVVVQVEALPRITLLPSIPGATGRAEARWEPGVRP